MANQAAIKKQLERFRSKIPKLEGNGAFSPEFIAWRDELLALTSQAFGGDSEELRALRSIPIEPQAELEQRAADISHRVLPQELRHHIEPAFRDAREEFFRKRLQDYREVIAGMIASLKDHK